MQREKDDKPPKGNVVKMVPTDDEAPGAVAPAAAAQQKTLATARSRALVISTVIASLAFAASNLFARRYDLVPGSNTDNNFVYRIDHLTGALRFCGQQQCSDVSVAAK